jgi:ribosomal 30S subunit maturation factor RimM
MQMSEQLWTYRPRVVVTADLNGFSVEAKDGSIGSVLEATHEAGASYIVVKAGPWIYGDRVLIPAGLVQEIDVEDRKVLLRLTRDEIRGAAAA